MDSIMAKYEVDRSGKEIDAISKLMNLKKEEQNRGECKYGAVWMRGVDWTHRKLLPTIGREYNFGGVTYTFTPENEKNLLHRFRRFVYEHLQRPITNWEALFLARHHGLPVRLLDWTRNPLAALYFACEFWGKETPGDACIWMMTPGGDAHDRIDCFNSSEDPWDVKGVRTVYPMVVSPRINGQCGLFTSQHDPFTALEDMAGKEFPDGDLDVARLVEVKVPGKRRETLLRELNEREVTRRTLFPDLDGIAQGLVNAEILRSKKWPRPKRI
jgi:hypothetical protein